MTVWRICAYVAKGSPAKCKGFTSTRLKRLSRLLSRPECQQIGTWVTNRRTRDPLRKERTMYAEY
jgi:hypothetical protein